jgi:hypothetical protein
MGSKPLIQVSGDAYVALIWNSETLNEIDVLHEAVPPSPRLRGAAFVKLASQPKL